MAVLIEAVSVVIRLKTIADKYPGGVDQYIKDCPNWTLCVDEEIVRVGFMSTYDAFDFIGSLERLGFTCIVDGELDEIAIVDQFNGIILPCDWLDCLNVVIFKGDIRVLVCQIMGGEIKAIALPQGWAYENSLSKQTIVMDPVGWNSRMTFIRHENGLDFYLNTITGQEMYVGRTGES